jgi:hypothetical protein
MTMIGVDCTFSPDGTVRVRRVEMGGQWQMVEQGRQWLDDYGRHVLVMLPGSQAREIILRPNTLAWEVVPRQNRLQLV